ncbi:response regulator transcription factor [Paraburkholderia bannensis]|uniref:response regulator transcription factor n=1 Tax=Paraburkholderia bannensis TaxID=765414 RepID=UPI002AB6F2E7|nr:response regulator transcription factor [Paraburkholderia bannensis]
MKTALVLEPDPAISKHVAQSLAAAGFSVNIETSGRHAIGELVNDGYHMVVLNLQLPDLDVYSIVASIRGVGVTTPMIVLDAIGNIARCIKVLRSGADDCLTLQLDWAESSARAMALLRLHARLSMSSDASVSIVLQGNGIVLDRVQRTVSVEGDVVRLRPTEFRLLEFLMLNPGRVITRAEILEVVWHRRFDPGTNIIDVNVGNLRSKIGRPAISKAIRTVRDAGYLFGSDNTNRAASEYVL